MSDNEKIEVGDQVRIMELDLREWAIAKMGPLLGKYGTVTRVYESGRVLVEVIDDCGVRTEYYYPMKSLALVNKKNHYFTGKVICTKSSPKNPSFCTFTGGKVYSIQNGTLYDDIKTIPFINNVEDVNYLNMKNEESFPGEFEFIEFKGFANK